MELDALNLHVTNRCNLSCIHCLYSSGDIELPEISFEEIQTVIRDFAFLSKNKGTVNLFGGEPLIRADIFEIINFASDLGLSIGITTNTLVSEKRLTQLAKSKVNRITIDLHGSCQDTHDWVRNIKGHFHKSVDAINFFSINGKRVSVNCALNKRNYDEVEDLMNFCLSLDIYALSFYFLSPSGRGIKLLDNILGPMEWMNQFDIVKRWIEKNNPKFSVIWERTFAQEALAKQLPKSMCRGGISNTVDIRCDGYVFFCGLLMSAFKPLINATPPSLGNIKDNNLVEIMRDRMDKIFHTPCGCPALALHANNDSFEKDPRNSTDEIVPVCPYDWVLLNGETDTKKVFAHINLPTN